MKARVIKTAIVGLEALGVAVGVIVAILALGLWRAQSGPVNLTWSAPIVEFLIESNNAGVRDARVRRITLVAAEQPGRYTVELDGVSLADRDANATLELPRTAFTFAARDLLDRQIGPERIDLENATLRIFRRSDYNLSLDYGSPETGGPSVFQSLTGGQIFRGAFKRAELLNARILFTDEVTGREWKARDARATIRRSKEGYRVFVSGEFDFGGAPASLEMTADYSLASEIIDVRLSLVEAPVGDIMPIFFGPRAEILSAPVTGEASLRLNKSGVVLSSEISGFVSTGTLLVGDKSIAVERLELDVDFDPATNEFEIHTLMIDTELAKGVVSGAVTLTQTSAAGPEEIGFDLRADEIQIAEPSGSSFLTLKDLMGVGAYSVADHRLQLARLKFGVFDSVVNVAGSGEFGAVGTGVQAKLNVEGALTRTQLLSVWPARAAGAARSFVDERVFGGVFRNINAEVNLPPGAAHPELGLPEDALAVQFEALDATVAYAPTMTPLKVVSGNGELRGNSFSFSANRGAVGRIVVSNGRVEIPKLRPKGHPAVFSFTARGAAPDVLSLLNEPPLQILGATGFSPEQFSGDVEVNAKIIRPNQKDVSRADYDYEASARISNVTINDIYRDIPLTEGVAEIDLTRRGMTVNGAAALGGAPVNIDWRQKFDASGDRTIIELAGVLNADLADLFGVPTRRVLRGDAPFTFKSRGDLGSIKQAALSLDLSDALVIVDPLSWRKDSGVPASAKLALEFDNDLMRLTDFSIQGEGVNVHGDADFARGGAIERARFDAVQFDGSADFRLAIDREPTGLNLIMSGEYLDASGLMRRFAEQGASSRIDWSSMLAGSSVAARFDRLTLRNDVVLQDASLDFRHGPARVEALEFIARDADGDPMAATLELTGDIAGFRQNLEMRADDIGSVLNGMFGIRSVEGGEGVLNFYFSSVSDDDGRFEGPKGTLEARSLKIVKAPMLARIFAAGSLTGLQELLTDEGGIEVAQAFADFSLNDGVVTMREARAAGPSVGITADGRFSLGDGEVNLRGAVAPAYSINSFLGKAPLIGDLFVNRDGEGLIALSYDISGTARQPTVTVNPLSALTPGVFRRMFEPQTDDAPLAAPAAPSETTATSEGEPGKQ